MYEHYGRRDPECFWCGETVYMSLQGFLGGGSWTTNSAEEGPGNVASLGAMFCEPSPDHMHDVLNA